MKVMPRATASADHFETPSVPERTLAMPRFTQPMMMTLTMSER